MDQIRVSLSGYPLQVLETRFHFDRSIDSAECEILGLKLGLRPRKIKDWFGNKRSRKGKLTSENLEDPEILKLLDEVRKETRNRNIVLSTEQKEKLEELYATGRQLGEEERYAIGRRMKLPEYSIRNWWTNRTRKERNERKMKTTEKESVRNDESGMTPDTNSASLDSLLSTDDYESYSTLRNHHDSQYTNYCPNEQTSTFGGDPNQFGPTEAYPANCYSSFNQSSHNHPNEQTATIERAVEGSAFDFSLESYPPVSDFKFPQVSDNHYDEQTSTFEANPNLFGETEGYPSHMHSSDCNFHQKFNNHHDKQKERDSFEAIETYPAHSPASYPHFRQNCSGYSDETISFGGKEPLQNFNKYLNEQRNPVSFGAAEADPASYSNFSQDFAEYSNQATPIGTMEVYPAQPSLPSDPAMNWSTTPQMPLDDGSRNYHNNSYSNQISPTAFDFPDKSTSEMNSQFYF